jgi:hypothetical protein
MAFTSLTRNEIIRYALLKLGVEYDDLTNAQIQYASDSLSVLVNSWQDEGLYLWQVADTTQALSASTATYTLSADVIDIERAFIRDGNTDHPVDLISAQEYADIVDKTDEAEIPTVAWFEKLRTPKIHLYPTPNSTTPVLHYAAVNNITESDDNSTALDFNKSKYNALIWNLSQELALDYDVTGQRYNIISSRARQYKKILFESSSETTTDDFIEGAY